MTTLYLFLYREHFLNILKIHLTEKDESYEYSTTDFALDYQRDTEENKKRIRKMVLDSYYDIVAGKGRICNEFFEELEKKLEKL